MTNYKQIEPNSTHPAITQEALAHLGDGRLAYVKAIRSEDVANLFPQAPKIAPGIKLFALHGADGTPNAAVAKMMKVEMKDLKSSEVQGSSDEDLKEIIVKGKGKMKPVKTVSGPAVDDVIAYVRSLKK